MGLLRTWLARHGTARGVGVFGSAGVGVFGSAGFEENLGDLAGLLSHHERLARWLTADGGALSYDALGVAAVEGRIDSWREDPVIGPQLGNEVGLYLGTVIVASVPGAAWTVWPNGHPVVTLPDRRVLDVVSLAADRVSPGAPSLTSLLQSASQ